MAHFAKIDLDNIVKQVIAVHNNELLDENGQESEAKGQEFCHNLLSGTWIQTSYNGKFRKNYAGIGYTYDINRDAFIPPKPFNSWVLNEETCRWSPPIPMPFDQGILTWNEETLSWVR